MLRNGGHSLNSSFRWEGTSATVQMTSEIRTPRPTPQFFNEHQTFSTKKERGTPRDHQPPRPPVKSAPPISRIFHQKPLQRAQPVSFKSAENSLLSAHYKEDSKQLYFDQCFEIDSKIGAGSFGEVFKVRSKEDGKFYAVKRSRERFRGKSDRIRKLEEVAKHEQLPKHPNCVGFVKAWEERQHLYIQTELCRTSLQQVAEQQHDLGERLIWNYIVDLLMAVKHLHDHDLVHMDIKPDNIFISQNDTCQLGDFGLVLDISKGVQYAEAQEGDPKYLAPELMAGKFGAPADVFSLGITLLELASDLDLPRGGDLWHALRSGCLPEEFLIGISCELKEVIKWMMEPDPEKRPTCAEVLAAPFIKKIHVGFDRDELVCIGLMKGLTNPSIWRKRRREQMIHHMTSCMTSVLFSLCSILVTLWHVVMHPLVSLLPSKVTTPHRTQVSHHPPDWDHSFSEDETFEDEELNLSNSSLGVPLNLSTSSEESFSQPLPSLMVRQVKTTPGYRMRTLRSSSSASSGSPMLSSFNSRISPSPFVSPTYSVGRQSITPNTSFKEKITEEPKLNIEPKNLLEAFECASSEEDVL